MFVAVALYLAFTSIIWWCYSGYAYYLVLYNLFRRFRPPVAPEVDPCPMAVIVPVLDERDEIAAKLENLLDLEYPLSLLDVIVADGGSTDGTRQIVESFRDEHPEIQIRFLACSGRGRSLQINEALPLSSAPIVVMTDADALLARPCLLEISRAFARSEQVAAVGAFVDPLGSTAIETKYWAYQNVLRWLESNVDTTSIVVGPCYAFRRELVERFPRDCSADDVHTCLLANHLGFQVKYLANARAVETRVPRSTPEFLNHKFRKANSYLIELLRFAYLFPKYRFKWKIVFATRLLQVLVLPFLVPLFLAMSVNFAFVSTSWAIAVGAVQVFLGANVLVVSRLLRWDFCRLYDKPIGGGSFLSFAYTNFILFFGVLSYLVYFQSDRPEKVAYPSTYRPEGTDPNPAVEARKEKGTNVDAPA